MKDIIVERYFENFLNELNIEGGKNTKNFEKFVNYLVMYPKNLSNFQLASFCVGDGNDTAIDGIGVALNNRLISTITEAEEMLGKGMEFDLEIYFVQAKTTEGFECIEIRNFIAGICDIFKKTTETSLMRNKSIKEYKGIIDLVLDNYMYAKSKKCFAYYITPGVYVQDQNQLATESDCNKMIESLNLFDEGFKIHIKGNDYIRKEYENTKVQNSAVIQMQNKIELPYIEGVSYAFLTSMSVKEFLKIVVDEDGRLRRGIFDKNVRDFGGFENNPVNQDVVNTITSEDRDLFGLLNNGITIVGRNLRTGNGQYTINDFYIVNGCQTTNILYENQNSITDSMWISVKIVITNIDKITDNIVKATNTQTEVKSLQLHSREEYQKLLESYYLCKDNTYKLYYERRDGQYRADPTVTTNMIVSMDKQMRSFASTFLEIPHVASRFVGKLEDEVSKKIFVAGHKPSMYYTSALINNMLENAFRNEKLDNKFNKLIYQLELVLFKLVCKNDKIPLFGSHSMDEFCGKLDDLIINQFDSLLIEAVEILCKNIDVEDADANKTQNNVNALLRYMDINMTKLDLSHCKYFVNHIDDCLIPFLNMGYDGDLRYNFEKNLNELVFLLQTSHSEAIYKHIGELIKEKDYELREVRKQLSRGICNIIFIYRTTILQKIDRSKRYELE